MMCPHCALPTFVAPMPVVKAREQRQAHLAGHDHETCPECGWWCLPPRDPRDSHLLARSADGRGTSWVP